MDGSAPFPRFSPHCRVPPARPENSSTISPAARSRTAAYFAIGALLHVLNLTGIIGYARHLRCSKAVASTDDELVGFDPEMEGLRGDSSDACAITRLCAGPFLSQICAASRPALRPGPSVPAETAARDSPAPAAVANLSSLPQNCPSRSAQPE